jgi:hypothetical protein
MSASVGSLPRALPESDAASSAVLALIKAHDLAEHLATALGLAEKVFPAGSDHSLSVEEDPDCAGKWVVMDWGLRATGDEAVRAYRRFVTEWNAGTPPWVGSFLRFTFHLV